MFIVKDLTNNSHEFEKLCDAEKRFEEFPNSTEIAVVGEDNSDIIIKSREHKEIGMIEINNKCVYVKVPFFQPSDKPEIRISRIGETPEKLKNKMDVIDEHWDY